MYSFGLKLWSINTDFYYDEAVRLYDKGVFDYIELYVVPDTLITLKKWRELKIPFLIHAPHSVHGFNLADREMKSSNYGMYLQVKEFADALEADYIIFHGGLNGCVEEVSEQLAGFCEERSLIENKPLKPLPHGYYGECRGCCLNELQHIISVSNCGFCLDVGHGVCAANSLGVEPYDFIKKLSSLKPRLYHLTDVGEIDAEYDSHVHLGAGELDFKRVFGMIFKGNCITIETEKSDGVKLDDFEQDISYIKNYISLFKG